MASRAAIAPISRDYINRLPYELMTLCFNIQSDEEDIVDRQLVETRQRAAISLVCRRWTEAAPIPSEYALQSADQAAQLANLLEADRRRCNAARTLVLEMDGLEGQPAALAGYRDNLIRIVTLLSGLTRLEIVSEGQNAEDWKCPIFLRLLRGVSGLRQVKLRQSALDRDNITPSTLFGSVPVLVSRTKMDSVC